MSPLDTHGYSNGPSHAPDLVHVPADLIVGERRCECGWGKRSSSAVIRSRPKRRQELILPAVIHSDLLLTLVGFANEELLPRSHL
jgi:hypothetical protein